MIKKSLSPAGFSLAAGIAIVLVAAGCATSTAAGRVGQESVVAAPPAGIVLAYKMPAGRVLRYIQTDEVKETSDRMGQILEGTRVGTGTDAFRSKGLKDGHFLLEVTIEETGKPGALYLLWTVGIIVALGAALAFVLLRLT